MGTVKVLRSLVVAGALAWVAVPATAASAEDVPPARGEGPAVTVEPAEEVPATEVVSDAPATEDLAVPADPRTDESGAVEHGPAGPDQQSRHLVAGPEVSVLAGCTFDYDEFGVGRCLAPDGSLCLWLPNQPGDRRAGQGAGGEEACVLSHSAPPAPTPDGAAVTPASPAAASSVRAVAAAPPTAATLPRTGSGTRSLALVGLALCLTGALLHRTARTLASATPA